MRWFSNVKTRNMLLAILAVAAVLRFWNLGGPDMVTDEVYYALRGIGYLDYIGSTLQSTPLFWFDPLPDWTKLSFHDHPPLVFAVLYLFFGLFGVSTFAARLPFALAGVGSVLLVYLIGRKMFSERVGLIAAAVMAISSHAVFASRTALMEPLAIVLILLTWYLFLLALDNLKWLPWWGIALGLSWLAKYTAFPVLVVCLTYLALYRRNVFRLKQFYLGLMAAALLFSPVIAYNVMLYQTRGHLDLQFTALLKHDVPEWRLLYEKTTVSYLGNFFGIFRGLVDAYSPLVLGLAVVGVVYSIWQLVSSRLQSDTPPLPFVPLTSPFGRPLPQGRGNRGKDLSQILSHKGRGNIFVTPSPPAGEDGRRPGEGANHALLIIFFVAYTLLLTLIKPLPRFLAYSLLAFPLLVGVFVGFTLDRWRGAQRRVVLTLLALAAAYELGFTVNTNLVPFSAGPANLAWSLVRPYTADFGINALDRWVKATLAGKSSSGVPQTGMKPLDAVIRRNAENYGRGKKAEKILLVYDTHLHETITLWVFDRRFIYQGWPAYYADEFSETVDEQGAATFQGYTIYYVTGTEYSLWRRRGTISEAAVKLEKKLVAQGFKPTLISNVVGLPVFKVYRFQL